ncbi:hypothetical protein [Aquamicrobium zhengzhouense]|uniref:Uncharacterized protein n=1 Tax=Aquamicrobium zhengzhouense TaxID=2781738 RepID=A0ABS0SBJ4_9HYPH|nr:hypothetical protein [Aquamicrobium zhengzhouense]MBI1620670.1 hypothetical protein [Aquamicrobium zhengzhouense]
MNRTLAAFALIFVLTTILAAFSIAVEIKGYPFGALGVARLDILASAATFIPLAALYAFCAALMMLLPLRAAGFIMANGAVPVFSTTLVLFATIVGVQLARFAFGKNGALWVLVDWQFIFAAGVVASHLFMNELRRNILLRTLFFVAFLAACLACLFWTFRL